MSIQTVVVRSFRIVTVSAGRKRREGEDIEADLDISGEADSDDAAAIETAVGQYQRNEIQIFVFRSKAHRPKLPKSPMCSTELLLSVPLNPVPPNSWLRL